jgi:hypothetical protein
MDLRTCCRLKLASESGVAMGNVESMKKTTAARRVHELHGTFRSGRIVARRVELLHACKQRDWLCGPSGSLKVTSTQDGAVIEGAACMQPGIAPGPLWELSSSARVEIGYRRRVNINPKEAGSRRQGNPLIGAACEGINGDVITQEVHAGDKMGTRRECWLAQIILGCKSIWNKWVRQDLFYVL